MNKALSSPCLDVVTVLWQGLLNEETNFWLLEYGFMGRKMLGVRGLLDFTDQCRPLLVFIIMMRKKKRT